MTEGIITSAITKFLELTPRYLAVVAFAIGVILFGSPETAQHGLRLAGWHALRLWKLRIA